MPEKQPPPDRRLSRARQQQQQQQQQQQRRKVPPSYDFDPQQLDQSVLAHLILAALPCHTAHNEDRAHSVVRLCLSRCDPSAQHIASFPLPHQSYGPIVSANSNLIPQLGSGHTVSGGHLFDPGKEHSFSFCVPGLSAYSLAPSPATPSDRRSQAGRQVRNSKTLATTA
ncbi:hypothetical protein PANT_25d00055 [Moesziomyces antarcticus T-34]|uniref:Uncharacterized protein n=1 Tax=Pseudozyma antarctica (strain T-34) TaxID=1151754 RepID=M9M7T6_PSEA3|nr:hypothetical protein PANT_25d00055 [Moesziomyces antarcticus T-34]